MMMMMMMVMMMMQMMTRQSYKIKRSYNYRNYYGDCLLEIECCNTEIFLFHNCIYDSDLHCSCRRRRGRVFGGGSSESRNEIRAADPPACSGLGKTNGRFPVELMQFVPDGERFDHQTLPSHLFQQYFRYYFCSFLINS